MNSTKLNETALQSLPDNVDVPNYDRSALKAGILHIGVGISIARIRPFI